MDFYFNTVNLVLCFMLFLLLIILLLLFFKLKKAVLISFISVLLLSFLVVYMEYRSQFITFENLAANQIDDESTYWSMTIWTYDVSKETPQATAVASIYDKKIIQTILDDFKDMELKRDDVLRFYEREYRIQITTRNHFTFYVDEDYIDHYEILNDTNHLQTIEYLITSNDVLWEYFED
ncbi:hypothetical protein [Evansella tamaricis]|uniref:Uncharacterized protein n=1 Tax=Evansella tamaricis TaxID=2069301 RepID=A0ABS6JFV9_9BACI|nr:hypothetical protein [Evansella tamaricis]MBU9712496.1 hypothetical protein [Evansella tamaricis]